MATYRVIVFSTGAQRNGVILGHSHSSTWKDFSTVVEITAKRLETFIGNLLDKILNQVQEDARRE